MNQYINKIFKYIVIYDYVDDSNIYVHVFSLKIKNNKIYIRLMVRAIIKLSTHDWSYNITYITRDHKTMKYHFTIKMIIYRHITMVFNQLWS